MTAHDARSWRVTDTNNQDLAPAGSTPIKNIDDIFRTVQSAIARLLLDQQIITPVKGTDNTLWAVTLVGSTATTGVPGQFLLLRFPEATGAAPMLSVNGGVHREMRRNLGASVSSLEANRLHILAWNNVNNTWLVAGSADAPAVPDILKAANFPALDALTDDKDYNMVVRATDGTPAVLLREPTEPTGGRLLDMRAWDTPGAHTWTPPGDARMYRALCTGGGSAGAGGTAIGLWRTDSDNGGDIGIEVGAAGEKGTSNGGASIVRQGIAVKVQSGGGRSATGDAPVAASGDSLIVGTSGASGGNSNSGFWGGENDQGEPYGAGETFTGQAGGSGVVILETFS